ncbi:serine protease gd-like [Drosophila innubila]|uniref:serine protease gd-like n=1 Tax=Drosophila innubila TaxID=198719 RepID=UPI00148BE62E|nr:serine protease gd-like [Drosophila innubila]
MASLQILVLTWFGLCLRFVLPQRVPPNGCSNIFQYEWMKDHWIGRITPNLPDSEWHDVDWTVEFCWHGVDNSGTVSNLEPYPTTAFQRKQDLGSGEAFVHFDYFENELPKIVLIEINGQKLCTVSSCEGSSSRSTATRRMRMALGPNEGSAEATATAYSGFSVRTFEPQIASRRNWGESRGPRIPNFGGNNNPFHFTSTSRKPFVIVEARQNPGAAECGLEGLSALQIGGENVTRGQYPWMAALYHDISLDPRTIELDYKCVATLISRRTVITAAHCIYGITPDQLRVYVGRHDVTVHPEKDATLMAVESVKTHPDFVGDISPDSDLGLLVLKEHVEYSTYVRPICLWSSSTSLDIEDTEKMVVVGWGNDGKSPEPTKLPMKVDVRPVSSEECLREMITARDFLTPRTLCGGNSQGHGPCLGDSGGGLMVLRNSRWMVRGIVSLAQRSGNSCDLSRYVIYCDVSKHLDWIERNIVR